MEYNGESDTIVSCADITDPQSRNIALVDILKELTKEIYTVSPSVLFSLRINLPLFSTVVPAIIFVLLSCRPFVAITTLSTGLVGVEVTSVSVFSSLSPRFPLSLSLSLSLLVPLSLTVGVYTLVYHCKPSQPKDDHYAPSLSNYKCSPLRSGDFPSLS